MPGSPVIRSLTRNVTLELRFRITPGTAIGDTGRTRHWPLPGGHVVHAGATAQGDDELW
jgi:hypothetical protein